MEKPVMRGCVVNAAIRGRNGTGMALPELTVEGEC
jgi:hypothetical protein